jgi:hypothetical protein
LTIRRLGPRPVGLLPEGGSSGDVTP